MYFMVQGIVFEGQFDCIDQCVVQMIWVIGQLGDWWCVVVVVGLVYVQCVVVVFDVVDLIVGMYLVFQVQVIDFVVCVVYFVICFVGVGQVVVG